MLNGVPMPPSLAFAHRLATLARLRDPGHDPRVGTSASGRCPDRFPHFGALPVDCGSVRFTRSAPANYRKRSPAWRAHPNRDSVWQ